MAGGVFSGAKLHGMTIRESADDGSDFTNPDADYRRLFLGEDGKLHLKDSAGSVTDIGGSVDALDDIGDVDAAAPDDGDVLTWNDYLSAWVPEAPAAGGGDVATDAIWDAAGDLAVGSGSNTAARLAIGAAGGALSVINSAVAWNSGTSFPASKATGDRYWRTDLGMEFYWDGTRWLCTCPHDLPLSMKNSVVFDGVSATTSPVGRIVVPRKGTLGIWLVSWDVTTIVVTTNNGTHYWTAQIGSIVAAGTRTAIGSGVSTASDSATTHTYHSEAIAAVLDSNAVYMDCVFTKVSSPGNGYMSGAPTIRIRYIAT